MRREEGESLDLSADEREEVSLDFDTTLGVSSDSVQIRIAIFLGDGTAIVSGPRWILDASGRLAELRINPWTGAPGIEREARLEAGVPEEEEQDSFEVVDDDESGEPVTGGGGA